MSQVAYLDGEWVDAYQPHLLLATQGLQYGTGVFEGIRAYIRQGSTAPLPFRALAHYERMLHSCGELNIDVGHSREELVDLTDELIDRNELDKDSYVRPLAFKTRLLPGTPFGVRLSGVGSSIALTVVPMSSRGCRPTRLWVAKTRSIPDASIPSRAKITGGYVTSALAVDEAVANGHDDALMLTSQGLVAEASTSNIFIRKGDKVLTPSLDQGILPGITRAVVIDLLSQDGVTVIERPIELAEVYAADEAWLTGTGLEVSPVVRLSGQSVGDSHPGPLTQQIYEGYERLVRHDVS